MIINIDKQTDLNEVIRSINKSNVSLAFTEANLIFDDWIYDNLPKPLLQIGKFETVPIKRDLALLSLLTIISGIVRKLVVDHDARLVGSQLYTYIIGNPASGKGHASFWKDCGMEYHIHLEQKFD